MAKREYNVILKFGDYTIISYEKQHMGTEYVIARRRQNNIFHIQKGRRWNLGILW